MKRTAVPLPALSPDEQARLDIRRKREAKVRREQQHVAALVAPLRPPEPNTAVITNQAAAAKERKKADVAVNRHTKRAHQLAAQRYDKAAQEARTKQLEEHWSMMADAETAALAEGRGEPLKLEATEVDEWVRDENGALARGDNDLPILRTERAKARRRKTGIEHVAEKEGPDGKPLMSSRQIETAERYGEICAAAASAVLGVKEETGSPATVTGKPSPGPADWKLEAMSAKKLVDYRLRIALGEVAGVEMTRLLEAICYEGVTPRQYAGGDERQGIRAEERFLIGLNILGVRGDFALPKVVQA